MVIIMASRMRISAPWGRRLLHPVVRRSFGITALLAGALLWGCTQPGLTVPTSKEVESAYLYSGDLSASINGNVAEVTIVQSAAQLERGGTLWAKVGPYVLLFSDETQELFQTYPGLAGVRVITETPGGTEVARALLTRDALNGITWDRAKHIAGLARRDGTKRPTLLQELVEWGEDNTEYAYNKRYVRS
jgi:hypothetical protein